MSNIMQARVILRHGNAADFDATAVETAELVFASDVGIIYIKKNDGTILAIGPHVESSDNKVVDPEASIAAADKANKFPSLAYIEGNYDKSSEVTSKINAAKTELQRIIRQQADGVENKHYFNDIEFNTQTGVLSFLCDGQPTGKSITLVVSGGGGLAFDGGYVDENGYMHFTQDGQDVEGFTPFFVGTPGSGSASGSRLTFGLTSPLSFSVADTSGTANITAKFQSIDTATSLPTGSGTLQVFVNEIQKRSYTVNQTPNVNDQIEINIFEYLSKGTNSVKLVLTDAYGVSATRRCTITVESISLTWNLANTMKNSGSLLVEMTPTGSGEKTLVLVVDNETYSTTTVATSGYRITRTITDLSHGEHIIEAYCTSNVEGSTISSDRLIAAVAQIEEGETDVVVASSFVATEVEQFTNITIPHRVVDPQNNPTEIEYIVNNVKYSEASVDQSEQIWTYRPTAAGTLTLEITCDGYVVWSRTVTVNSLNMPVSEITDGLALKFDPAAMSSNSSFVNIGQTMNIQLSQDFDTVNGGLQNDTDGNRAFVVMKGDRAIIPFQMFASDAKRLGKEIKLIYAVDNCSSMNATAISCMDDGIGVQIKANSVSFSSDLSSIQLGTFEKPSAKRTEIDISVESDSKDCLIRIYEGGVPSRLKQYSGDSFTQTSPQGITIGSDDCNVWVYLIREYETTLEHKEVFRNYIYDGADAAEISKRYNASLVYDPSTEKITPELVAQVCPRAHVFTWHASALSTAKDVKKYGYLTHAMAAGSPIHQWTARNVMQKAQGTSSLDYWLAGLNFDYSLQNGVEYSESFIPVLDEHGDPVTDQQGNPTYTNVAPAYAMTDDSIPVSYFNFKVNTASSEHINNMFLAEWFNRFTPYKRAARLNDSRVRDTVEGHMAVMFYHNTGNDPVQAGAVTVLPGETILYAVGNLNNSKKNYEVFGQDDTDDIACIEFRNNTSAQCRFKSADLTNETWDGETNFEFRYLSKQADEEQIKAKFQALLEFVVSCDPDQATGENLESAVTYGGRRYAVDNADYRKARWKALCGDYFIMDTIFYHQIFTLFFCMMDNRAKNTFWGYSAVQDKWHLCFGYDFDTAMGNDNEGDMTRRYGYLDTDTIGNGHVFNGYDSVPFALNREVFATELREMYIDLENDGCFDTDEIIRETKALQEIICPVLYLEDAIKKYEAPLTVSPLQDTMYLPKCNGQKRQQRENFLTFQGQFMSTYMRSGFCKTKHGTIRGYTPSEYAGVSPDNRLTITPYCDTFLYVVAAQQDVARSSGQPIRAYAGVPVTIEFPGIGNMNDTEIEIYNADYIQDIGEIACLYPGECSLSAFERLKYARIGSSTGNYVNTNLHSLSVANCKALEYVNVEGCTDLTQPLDFSPNIMLKELYTRRSGVTGVTFAKGGRIESAYLNEISALRAKELVHLETLSLANIGSLRTLVVENSPAVNALQIVQNAVNLSRLRITGVDWELPDARLLVELARLSGYDDDGYETETAVITGECDVQSISQYRYNVITTAFPKLTLNTDTENFVASFTLTFKDYDGTVLDTQIVEEGEDAENPVTRSYKPIAVPERDPSVDTVYSFGGWDKPLTNITTDNVIFAIYTTATRKYTVNFYNGTQLLQTSEVAAHGSVYYDGTLYREGTVWTGWSNSTTNVVSDVNTYAVFEEPAVPEYAQDLSQFTYLYSEDPADASVSAYTMGQLYAICEAGRAKDFFAVGAKIKLLPGAGSTITDTSIIFQVFGYNHFKISDTNNFANVVFGMLGILNQYRQMNSGNTNVGGFDASAMKTWLNGTMLGNLSKPWQALIKTVDVLASKGGTNYDILTSRCKLFLFADPEVGANKTAAPYMNEVDPGAETLQLPIFTDNASRIKKTDNGTGSAYGWWLRSATASNTTYFEIVDSNGYIPISYNASGAGGVCFGFCI